MTTGFVLGHETRGFFGLLAPGDYVEILQNGDFGASNLLVFAPVTTAPVTPLPAGYSWIASIRIDGTTVSQRTIGNGQTPQTWINWILDISKVAPGAHDLAFRLTLSGPSLPPAPASPVMEVEIPSFTIQEIFLETSTGPLILNQQPDIGAGTPPPTNTAIDFDIVDLGMSGIDTTTINVTINGNPAITGGVFQTGYSGSVIVTAQTAHVHIQPANRFASASLVTVSVTASTLGATPLNPTPTTWQFHVIDDQPPVLVSVTAMDTTRLRATWSESVRAIDPTGAHDALNPALYALVPLITVGDVVPAVTPIVTSIAPIAANQYDLTTDIDLSPGVTYSLTANGVADLVGNTTLTIVDFVAFLPLAPKRRDFVIYRMFPLMNRQEDMDATRDLLRFASCLQEVANLLLYDIDRWSDILDPDLAPEQFVDAMLSDLGNPFPFVLTLIEKRKLVQLLVPIYKEKGTPDGIIDAVRFFLGIEVTVTKYDGEGMQLGVSQLGVDWILGPGDSFALYSFRIVSPVLLTADQLDKITRIGNYMKCAHEHLIEVIQPFPVPPYNPMVLGISRLGVDWYLH